MAVVHGIIERHGGMLKAQNQYGERTAFTIFFPVHDGLVEDDSYEQKTLLKGNECILFVDDDASIVTLSEGLLRSIGDKLTSPSS